MNLTNQFPVSNLQRLSDTDSLTAPRDTHTLPITLHRHRGFPSYPTSPSLHAFLSLNMSRCPCCSCHPSHPFYPTTNYTSDSLWFYLQYPSSLLTFFLLYQPWQKPHFLFQVCISSSLRNQKVPRRQPYFIGVCLPSLPGSKRSYAKLRAPN